MDVGTDIMAVLVVGDNHIAGWSGWVNLSTEFEKLRSNQQIYYKLYRKTHIL